MKFLQRVEKAAVVIQSYYRGWCVRQSFKVEQAALVIQKYFRCVCAYVCVCVCV